jgi:hypothetical protein
MSMLRRLSSLPWVTGRLVVAFALLVVAPLASACSGISDPSGVATVEIQRADGQPLTTPLSWPYGVVLKAVARDNRRRPVADQSSLVWSTSDEKVLAQSHRFNDARGTVFETKGVGTVTVTATVDGKTATATLRVDLATAVPVWAWPDTSRMLVGTTRVLVVRDVEFGTPVLGGDGVRWESSDLSVATVDQQGNVTTVAEGHATITAVVSGHSIPAEVFVFRYPSPLRFASVAVGYHSVSQYGPLQRVCAVTTDGALYCWGFAVDGTISDQPTDRCMRVRMLLTGRVLGTAVGRCSVVPVAVRPDLRFASVSMNDADTCALAVDGTAYCWGVVPAPVGGDLKFRSLDLGSGVPLQNTACGLTTSDVAYCWGANQHGQLGNGTAVLPGSTVPPPTPTPVAGGLLFQSISAGTTVCGITREGATYCWGANDVGQAAVPIGTDTKTPIRITGDRGFVQVQTGIRQTCALDVGGSAYCWGAIGSVTAVPTPTPVAVSGGLRFTSLVTHKPCGVTVEAAVYCWNGELVPTQVDNPFPTRAYWSSAVRFALGTDGLLRWWDFLPNGNPANTFFHSADVPDGLVIGSLTPVLVPGQE